MPTRPEPVASTPVQPKLVRRIDLPAPAVALSRPAGEACRPIPPEHRHRMICDAAYFRAERRGFANGDPSQDWLEAEAEIDRLLSEHPTEFQ